MSTPDLISMARTTLAASSTAKGELATFYTAAARIALARALEELADLQRLLAARETELARLGGST